MLNAVGVSGGRARPRWIGLEVALQSIDPEEPARDAVFGQRSASMHP